MSYNFLEKLILKSQSLFSPRVLLNPDVLHNSINHRRYNCDAFQLGQF